MRAVLIDPTAKAVEVVEVQSIKRTFGEKPKSVLRLPRGEVLLAAEAAGGDAFILGGSRPIAGAGLIVGRRGAAGERWPVRIDPRHIEQMVRWTTIQKSQAKAS